jgi:hypothetical protein
VIIRRGDDQRFDLADDFFEHPWLDTLNEFDVSDAPIDAAYEPFCRMLFFLLFRCVVIPFDKFVG